MFRTIAVALAALSLAACTTTATKTAFGTPARPASGQRILTVKPDIELSLLTAAGMNERRADWSDEARDNVARALQTELQGRSHQFKPLDPDTAMGGRAGQLLRLNNAVSDSILMSSYGAYRLPTKKTFDWTLGDGARTLGAAYDGDYALFITARGNYASGGRVVAAIGLSMMGVGVPLGHQIVQASLVDLKSGQVIWFDVAVAGPSDDMRKPEGAASLVKAVLKNLPL